MLVLSRYIYEVIVIGDRFWITLSNISRVAIKLEVHDSSTLENCTLLLDEGHYASINPDIRLSFCGVRRAQQGLVQRAQQGLKARIGIEVPRDVSVHRKEVWGALHPGRDS
jgi:sRNA-binding carbon storage regulator CsrA